MHGQARSRWTVSDLMERNRAWSLRMRGSDAGFFRRLSVQQMPELLWIGCSDSRVAANQILDLAPGEVFTHRNIANIVSNSDLNCLSVLQFAVDVLRVRHIMVVGHYGCGGIRAAWEGMRLGLADSWIAHICQVRDKHAKFFEGRVDLLDPDTLCELNIAEQFWNVCQTHTVQDAWRHGQDLRVHALVYGLTDGLLRPIAQDASCDESAVHAYRRCIARVGSWSVAGPGAPVENKNFHSVKP